MTVFMVTFGDGSYGDAWGVEGVFSTVEKAKECLDSMNTVTRSDGSTYSRDLSIEEWGVDLPTKETK